MEKQMLNTLNIQYLCGNVWCSKPGSEISPWKNDDKIFLGLRMDGCKVAAPIDAVIFSICPNDLVLIE